MQKSILLLALSFLCFSSFAQKIEVKEGTEKFSTGSQNALSVTIYGNTKDDVESKWKSLLKDFKNEKVKSSGGEIFGDNILIKDMGNNPVDVYTTFTEDKKTMTVTMNVAVDLGGAYLKSSEKDRYKVMEKIMKDFAMKMTKDALQEKVDVAAKALGKLEDQQKDLEKENKNLHGDIDDYNKKIAKANEDIKTNEQNQQKKKTEIEAQKKAVDEAKKLVDKVD